jgi:phosphate starvation-inducible PhoH-like protein
VTDLHLPPVITDGQIDLTLPDDHERLSNLNGSLDAHLRLIEQRLGVEVRNRAHFYRLVGSDTAIRQAMHTLQTLYAQSEEAIEPQQVHMALLEHAGSKPSLEDKRANEGGEVSIRTKRGVIRGRTPLQRSYLKQISEHDVTFGIGPAGTGKTYLAVASAVMALEQDKIRRILLVRPAVEAGEKLGFLPGDFAQKVDPYLRPLYDALYEMLGFERVAKLIERNVIEVAPLAYMRGRTLNESFIILDEAQNTTTEQMKMFLTRLGFGSKAVITGDASQIDLPIKDKSGLKHAEKVLLGVKGVAFTRFKKEDVVRHPLVALIVGAYERQEAIEAEERAVKKADRAERERAYGGGELRG